MINVESFIKISIGGQEYSLPRAEALKLLLSLKQELGGYSLPPVEYQYLVQKWQNFKPSWVPEPGHLPGTIIC